MTSESRRVFLGGLAAGAGALTASQALGAAGDGHAAGGDVASSSEFVRTIPRKTGAPQAFTASLDAGKIKATSGGWARDLTTNQLPIATGIAGAHLFLNPGGVREMHWHTSAEWGYIVAGQCQATIVDPDGRMEIVNFGPGDTWSFPGGHAHAIQTIGTDPCHAILTFDDGLYGDHGTFGLTDWMSRLDGSLLETTLRVPASVFKTIPEGETYIMQGPVVPLDGESARTERRLDPTGTHRFALAASEPIVKAQGGEIRVAPAKAFPVSNTMTGFLVTLQPGAIHAPHWHAGANEWHYVVKGRARVNLFEPEKRLAVADLDPGDCAYIPKSCGHSVQSLGPGPCELIGVHDSGAYSESSLATWLARVPRHLIAANLGLSERDVSAFPDSPAVISLPG